MAHTKAQRAVRGNRDSRSKRRGVKLYGGQQALAGNVIVRQKGTLYRAGDGVLLSRDFTLIALRDGVVKYTVRNGQRFVSVNAS